MADRTIDTGTDDLLAEVADGVATLTMNRPDRRNALSTDMLRALGDVLAECDTASDVGCIVLTGAGGAFCAGGDVKGFAAAGGEGGGSPLGYDERVHRQRLDQRRTAGRLFEMPKPTIAAISGPAAGAGLSLALACHLRYAVSGAKLTTAFAKVGFSGDYGGTWFMSRLIGIAKAQELYYLSDVITAEQAEGSGSSTACSRRTDSRRGCATSPSAWPAARPSPTATSSRTSTGRSNGEMNECLDMEAAHHVHCGQTQDHKDAVQAFVEKRPPVFHGR